MAITGPLKAGLCQADIPVQERSKYFPKVPFYGGVLLEMALQVVDCPDDPPAAQADPADGPK
jgi:hypothetical protein